MDLPTPYWQVILWLVAYTAYRCVLCTHLVGKGHVLRHVFVLTIKQRVRACFGQYNVQYTTVDIHVTILGSNTYNVCMP